MPANYWPHIPWRLMVDTIGLRATNVQFSIPAPTAWNFTVEVSTNLSDWTPLHSHALRPGTGRAPGFGEQDRKQAHTTCPVKK